MVKKGFLIKTLSQYLVFILLFTFIGCREVPRDENNTTKGDTSIVDDKKDSTQTEEESNSTQNNASVENNTSIETDNQENDTQEEEKIPSTQVENKNFKTKFISQSQCDQILDNEFITICYNYKAKGAKSVAYTLEGDLVNQVNIKDRPSFYVEQNIEKKYRITNTDYINSGYDRGHLAPDAGFDWSQESLDAVYTFANIIPQAPQTNRNTWAQLEKYARDKAVELGQIDVINIVKYNQRSKRMGKNRMAISKGYYKILYNANEEYEECFYYDNKLGVSSSNDNLTKHLVECSEVSY